MFKWFRSRSSSKLAYVEYLRTTYIESKDENQVVNCTEEEFQFLLNANKAARTKSIKPAMTLTPTDPVPDHDWESSLIGSIRVLKADSQWPTSDGKPMLPLLQLRVSDLPLTPKELEGVQYLLAWCALESYPQYPEKIHNKYLLSMLKGNKKALAKIEKKHKADILRMNEDADPDHIHVELIYDGQEISKATRPGGEIIFTAKKIRFDLVQDAIETNEQHHLQFMSSADAKRAEQLLDIREFTNKQYDQMEEDPPHYSATKIGGWPSLIQSFPEFDGESDFVLQIKSDSKAGTNMMFCDDGTIYIGQNRKTREWVSEWSCY